MGLTSSLFAGLSGMKSNEFRMDVIGDNIANVNTYAFKSSRVSFQNQFLNTFSFGSAPDGLSGGTNPSQVGTGSGVGAISRDFQGGAPESTGKKTDMAVLGDGLFILQRSDGANVYTRDGSFEFNSENYLMSSDGYFLQGYTVDDNFNVIEGALSSLRIPLGEITTATPTGNASFSGVLNSVRGTNNNLTEGVPTDRPVCTSSLPFETAPGTAATTGTALTALVDASSNTRFYTDNVITLKTVSKGGAMLSEKQFIIGTTGSTVGDYLAWLEDALGIATIVDDPDLLDLTGSGVANPGVTLDASGNIIVTSNIGVDNIFSIAGGDIEVTQGAAATPPLESAFFGFTNNYTADQIAALTSNPLGESIRTSFTAYDSLGAPITISITLSMESKSDGTVWRYFANSGDDTDASRFLGTGTIEFTNAGNYSIANDTTIAIHRDGTGALSPMTVQLDFSHMECYQMESAISLLGQDGFQAGTLQDYSISSDGIIVGSFTNGQTRTLGQIVLATFRNYEGLVADGQNVYVNGANSGDAIVKKAQELGAGSVASGALELSNVDLSREFINLIVSSTGFSAASRIIQTSDQLLDELIRLSR